jgi:hypothetical protein
MLKPRGKNNRVAFFVLPTRQRCKAKKPHALPLIGKKMATIFI